MENRNSPKKTPVKEKGGEKPGTPKASTSSVGGEEKVKRKLFNPFRKKQAAPSTEDDLAASPPVIPRLVAVNPNPPSDDSDSGSVAQQDLETSGDNEDEQVTGTDSAGDGGQLAMKKKAEKKKTGTAAGSKSDPRTCHRASSLYKPLEYVEKDASRTNKFNERGKVLERKVKEIMDVTHCQGFLKLQYISKRKKTITFSAGKDFVMAGENVDGPIKVSQLESVVEKAVSSSMKKFIAKEPAATPEAEEEMIISTPVATRKKTKRLDACVVCFGLDEDIKMRSHDGEVTSIIKTVFIGCSHQETDEEYCRRQVHADCIGFPNVTDTVAQQLPNWYCKLHITQARSEAFLGGANGEGLEPAKKKGIFSSIKKSLKLNAKKGQIEPAINEGASTSTEVAKKRGRPKKTV